MQDYGVLFPQFLCDIIAAASASLAVSPLVAVVDRSVVQYASSSPRKQMLPILWASLKPLLRSPHTFLVSRTTRLLFTVYFGTYTTANALDTLRDNLKHTTCSPLSPTTIKLLGVSTISTALTVYKDSRLTQMFGATSKSPVPMPSYFLFAARDILTIYGCFVCPPLLAQRLNDIPEPFKHSLSLSLPEARMRVSQLVLPVLVQFFSTPIHLLALDLYNRRHRGVTFSDRLARVWRDMPAAVPTRMLRILPAFGFGGVLNTEIRGALLDGVKQVE